MADSSRLKAVEAGTDRDAVESAVFEIKRVIVGQDEMLERVLVGLLAGGHLLLEGVPGLAKTLTIKTLAEVLGGSFQRIQFTPDLVPSDLVGTRIYRSGKDEFDTELGPVFCNFLLADEINRAPAKVQSALLEVMQERQVTIGKQTHAVPSPFLVMATQNPIESEGTYPLPEAQVDRFMLKVLVDYPTPAEELDGRRALARRPVAVEQAARARGAGGAAGCGRRRLRRPGVFALRRRARAAPRGSSPTRGLEELAAYVAYGASPRGSINLIHGARALALLRGRRYVAAAGRPRARPGRPAPPARAQLRGARRGRRRRHDPRPRPRDVADAAPRPRRGEASHERRHALGAGSARRPARPGPDPGCAPAQARPRRSPAHRRPARRRPPRVRRSATAPSSPRSGRTRPATTSA